MNSGIDDAATLLLWCPDGSAIEASRLSPALAALGLIIGDGQTPDAAKGRWRCQFGPLAVVLETGGVADAALRKSLDDARSSADAPRQAMIQGMGQSGAGVGAVMQLTAVAHDDNRADVAQQLCTLASLLTELAGATALYWGPARLWSSTQMLAGAVTAYEQQGLPPILHIVDFDYGAPDRRGGRRMVTHGLGWLVGHELHLSCPSAYPHSDALRRLSRLAIDALMHAGLVGPMIVNGMVKGEKLAIGGLQPARPFPFVAVDLLPPG